MPFVKYRVIQLNNIDDMDTKDLDKGNKAFLYSHITSIEIYDLEINKDTLTAKPKATLSLKRQKNHKDI